MTATHNIYLIDLPLMIVLISLVYSATRYDQWSAILYETVRWGTNLLRFLAWITVILLLVNSFNWTLFIVAASIAAIDFIYHFVNWSPTRAGA